jgi:hypothetical protein
MFNEDGHRFFLCNGGDYHGILADMDLRMLASDVLFKDDDPTMVPKKNARGNRGPSLLFTGSQSQKRGVFSQFAKPILVSGSKRYWPLYIKITNAIRAMAAHRLSPDIPVFPDPFPTLEDMPTHQQEWSGTVAEGNCVESCSFLMYTSEFGFLKDATDRLISHVDRGNGKKPGWDWLATFWEQYFDENIRRWVLIVVSATTRSSIEEYHARQGCIGNATNILIEKYKTHPDHQRLVIPASLCPNAINGDHRVVPIHFDTLVFLSPLLWHVHKMRRYWYGRGKRMSSYLATEMLVGFFKTNNPLRFHRFSEKLYEDTKRTGILGIPPGSTFLQELESFLFVTYGGWNGTTNEQGLSEGSMRTQPCTSQPQTDWSQESALIFWLRTARDTATRFDGKAPNETDHGRLVKEIKSSMIGLGDLFAQKLIFADAAIGLNLPVSFFENCLPGSGQHMKVLKKHPFLFQRGDQVKQLVTSIAVKQNLVREVAEELVCLTLKSEASLSTYQEVSIKGCDLFSAVLDKDKRIRIRRLDNKTKRQLPAQRGGFSTSADCHYYPKWAQFQDASEYSYNHAQMTSKSNFKFSVIPKTSPTQIRTMEKESNHFAEVEVDFAEVQVLLNSNKYLHIGDPIGKLARYLHVSKKDLIQSINVGPRANGFIATIDIAKLKEVKLDIGFQQIHEMALNRRPIVDVMNSTEHNWNYRSRNGAILALFVHCISNLHL